jgi:hypothetical protein
MPTRFWWPKSPPDDVVVTERIVRRTQLVPRSGDVLLYREPAGIQRPQILWLYRYQVIGTDLTSGVFTTYGRAVTHAELFAATGGARLFYAESRNAKPQLLKESP